MKELDTVPLNEKKNLIHFIIEESVMS